MYRLENGVQHYDWGSPHAIPAFLGEASTGEPVAEVWMGTHPVRPSTAVDDSGRAVPLRDVAGDLPFMAKLLAAARPLSLQVHPTRARAARGFEAEQEAGIAIDAAERSFKDANHKPEIVYALTPFRSLLGFRSRAQIVEVLEGLGTTLTDALCRIVAAEGSHDSDAVSSALTWLLGADRAENEVGAVVEACRARTTRGDDPLGAYATVVELARTYPDDVGLVVSLLLNRVELQPGQAAFISAGAIHAHLEGLCLEVMASSDNVLRAGLTSKHVDRAGLIGAVDTTAGADLRIAPTAVSNNVDLFDPGSVDLVLAVVDVSRDETRLSAATPSVVLCTEGTVEILPSVGAKVVLRRGESALVDQGDGRLRLSGSGVAAWAGSQAPLLAH